MMLARFLGRAERELGALRILAGQGDEDRGGVRFAKLELAAALERVISSGAEDHDVALLLAGGDDHFGAAPCGIDSLAAVVGHVDRNFVLACNELKMVRTCHAHLPAVRRRMRDEIFVVVRPCDGASEGKQNKREGKASHRRAGPVN